jgi:hypothetical protein
MTNKQKLELTWIGKEKRPKLEPRILLEEMVTPQIFGIADSSFCSNDERELVRAFFEGGCCRTAESCMPQGKR